MRPTTVFLTGGTGYLGSELLSCLLGAGHEVRVLMRREQASLPPGAEAVVGDLSDAGRLARQMRSCSVVFHAAALVSSWAPKREDFFRTNVDGLRNVLRAAEEAGVKTVVYTSSFFALGPAGPPGAREDARPEATAGHPYVRSKSLARVEAARARAAGYPVVTLYPGVIYGPGRETPGNLVGRLISDFVAGRTPGLLGDGRQVWSFAFIGDVACGHLSAMDRASGGGEYVLGGDNVALRDFYAVLARLVHREAPRRRIPAFLGACAGALEYARARLRGVVPAATPSTVLMMYKSWACDSSRARAELGYSWRSVEQGLRATLAAMGISPGEAG